MKRHSALGGLLTGAIAGGVATWVMDLVTTGLQQGQSEMDAAQERSARANGRSSVENLLDLIEGTTGVAVSQDLRPTVLKALHYGLGVGPGALYGALRDRIPGIGAARGLVYGTLVWAVNDEYVNAALGLSGPPDAYPGSTHLRGLIGHLALGATTDTLLDIR